MLESGKPLVQARGEWHVAADLFEWFAEEGKRAYGRIIPSRVATKRMLVLKQPLGVVGLITAWNFPAYNVARAGGGGARRRLHRSCAALGVHAAHGDGPDADARRGRRAAWRRQPRERRAGADGPGDARAPGLRQDRLHRQHAASASC